ncbi:helix-turn-helix domain-containing protein [Nocardia cyriacigeorgica]|uniref:helix-turn-helix domain-containing protein n=1 Tax=Nocardia cyriacigeorgica TaxID=135487 RepID=UPI0024538DC4|nr:XRE family transcriptional regulator [Nocardia cyriacigeorgica]
MFTDGAVTGGLLRELRTVAGIGLRAMAARTAFTPGYLSLVETGCKPVTAAVVEAYRSVLADPVLGLEGVDVERLQATVRDPAGAGAGSLDDIAVILDRTRHLEDVVGPALVVQLVRGMDGAARAVAGHHGAGASLASEVARYRGWLEHATDRPHLADRVLGDAARLAEQAGNRDQLAHAHSFRAYTARHRGDLRLAVDLTEAAIGVTGAHPILGVYDRYQRAELLALQGEHRAAARALHRADRAADAADGIALPSFGYWYTRPFFALQGAVVLAAMGRGADAVRVAEQGYAGLPDGHRGTSWSLDMMRQAGAESSP